MRLTPRADGCLPGITRAAVIEIARQAKILTCERNISLSEIYTADEIFSTGTMGEFSPVLEVDGRTIGTGKPGPATDRLRKRFTEITAREGEPLPF